MRSFEGQTVPFKIQYRYRPQEYGDQLVGMYLLTNDKESKLGTTPLPDGVVKVFRDNGRDGLSYLAEQTIKSVAIGDKIELNPGSDPEVIFELIKLRASRDDIWMQINGANVFKRVEALLDCIATGEHQFAVHQSSHASPSAPCSVEAQESLTDEAALDRFYRAMDAEPDELLGSR